MAPEASWVVMAGMVAVALGLAAFWMAAARRAFPGVRAALLAIPTWLAVTALVASTGVLARFDARPPPLVLLLGVVVAVSLGVSLSRAGKALAQHLPLAWLVGFQAFRLPLELVMHQAAVEGVMPPQMSYGGYNFDIVSGATALLLGAWCLRTTPPRAVLWAWNLLGSALLLNIIAISVASTPIIHAFGTQPRELNTWVAHPPYVWLPTVMVVSALCGHILLARRLVGDQSPAALPAQLEGATCSNVKV